MFKKKALKAKVIDTNEIIDNVEKEDENEIDDEPKKRVKK